MVLGVSLSLMSPSGDPALRWYLERPSINLLRLRVISGVIRILSVATGDACCFSRSYLLYQLRSIGRCHVRCGRGLR